MNSKKNELKSVPDIVRFENVMKTYHLGSVAVPVLKGLDFSILKGGFVGIMGVSGSGKSTLLNLLGLLDVPTSGKYFLSGLEVEHFSDNHLAKLRNKSIGFIFQSFNLFPHLTVAENIEVPMVYGGVPKHLRRETARELGERMGLGHRLNHKPTELSGGECQRIAIARSLSNNPVFLLADEPTGNLDEKTSEEILELFGKLHEERGMTIVMVTHNPELRRIFDTTIVLRDGLIDDIRE